jgi:hypothetical protein
VPRSKATFYFAIAALVAIDPTQAKYQKRLNALRAQGRATVQPVK